MTLKRILFVLAVAVLAVVGWRLLSRGESEPRAGSPWASGGGLAQPPATVRLATVERGEFAVKLEAVGTLRANATAELYAQTSGPIVEMNASIGDPVRRGQVLARIDPLEERERVERERAALRMAEATRMQRRAALEVAATTDARVRALHEQSLVSEQDREAAAAALLSARAEVEVAEAAVALARANLTTAQVELDNTRILAPFDGYVGQRFLDFGAFATANRPVLSVVDLSTIKTTVSLVQKDAARIAPGQPAVVTSEAFPGREFGGRVARIASVYDPQTNTVEAEVEVDNPGQALKPGMFATVAVTYRTEPTALLVPREALLEDERDTAVFVAREGEEGLTARRVAVTRLGTSVQDDGRVAVEGAVAAGDRVVTLGHEILRDGAAVRVAGDDGAAEGGGRARGGPDGPAAAAAAGRTRR